MSFCLLSGHCWHCSTVSFCLLCRALPTLLAESCLATSCWRSVTPAPCWWRGSHQTPFTGTVKNSQGCSRCKPTEECLLIDRMTVVWQLRVFQKIRYLCGCESRWCVCVGGWGWGLCVCVYAWVWVWVKNAQFPPWSSHSYSPFYYLSGVFRCGNRRVSVDFFAQLWVGCCGRWRRLLSCNQIQVCTWWNKLTLKKIIAISYEDISTTSVTTGHIPKPKQSTAQEKNFFGSAPWGYDFAGFEWPCISWRQAAGACNWLSQTLVYVD